MPANPRQLPRFHQDIKGEPPFETLQEARAQQLLAGQNLTQRHHGLKQLFYMVMVRRKPAAIWSNPRLNPARPCECYQERPGWKVASNPKPPALEGS
jgi:hypothetical protein